MHKMRCMKLREFTMVAEVRKGNISYLLSTSLMINSDIFPVDSIRSLSQGLLPIFSSLIKLLWIDDFRVWIIKSRIEPTAPNARATLNTNGVKTVVELCEV